MSRQPRTPRSVAGVENRRHVGRDGVVWWTFRVRWTDATRTRRSEEFDDQAAAGAFRDQVRVARRGGALAEIDAGRETLTDHVDRWWETWALTHLEPATQVGYQHLWNAHLLPRVGHFTLRQLDPYVIEQLVADMQRDGVGAATIRKSLAVLQSILSRAVSWRRISHNPVSDVSRPPTTRKLAVIPLAPVRVEALRAAIADHRDATMVSVMAYAGLRPEELLGLAWRHVRRDTLLVERKVVDGTIYIGQKTKRAARTVDLLAPLRSDLVAWRMAAPRSRDDDLVFARPDDGRPFKAHDYRNWRRRRYQPAAVAVGAGPRPYDLRHSFASLLIHEGRLSPVEIADQLGHSTQTLLKDYAHVFSELRGQDKMGAVEAIAAARAGHPASREAPDAG